MLFCQSKFSRNFIHLVRAVTISTLLILFTSCSDDFWECLWDVVYHGESWNSAKGCESGEPGTFPEEPVCEIIDDGCTQTKICRMPVSGHAGGGDRQLWAGLSSNGTVVASSQPVAVQQGYFENVEVQLTVPNGSVPPGDYDFIVVMNTGGAKSAGDLSSYVAMTSPTPVTISEVKSAATDIPCFPILYGDSISLQAEIEGGKLVISQRGANDPPTPLVTWAAVSAGTDTTAYKFFVLINATGTFFPLKPNNGDERIWLAQAYLNGLTAHASIGVNDVVELGHTNNTFDGLILAYAETYGVPPTLSKAQIYDEASDFDPNAYAYELEDFDYFFIAVGEARGSLGSVLDEYPYYNYNMEVNAGWPEPPQPQGTLLTAADIAFRERYVDGDTDANEDGFITAYEIYYDSSNSQQGLELAPRDFIAQTPMAGSYGLKQLWWEVTLHPLNWNSGNGGRPVALVVPATNLDFGTRYLRWMYDNYTDTLLDWHSRWQQALNRYNGGPGSSGTGPYAGRVYSYMDECRPHAISKKSREAQNVTAHTP